MSLELPLGVALRTLLTEVIDYAGLFPPAALTLSEAAAEYQRHRQEAESWMLSRFVCPAPRLAELSRWHDGAATDWPISSLLRGGASTAEFFKSARDDLHTIANSALPRACEQCEMRLPGELVESASAARFEQFWRELTLLPWEPLGAAACFVELPPDESDRAIDFSLPDKQHLLRLALDSIGAFNRTAPPGLPRIGFKLRTGGLKPHSVPSCESVATVLAACRAAGVSWKATAGLHQPLRHAESDTHTLLHGYFNLLLAAVLERQYCLSSVDLSDLLDEQDWDAFTLDDDVLGWRQWCVSTEQIRSSRQSCLVSFGSCSFAEPRDGLMELMTPARRA